MRRTRLLISHCADDCCEVLWSGAASLRGARLKDVTLAQDLPVSSDVFAFHNLKYHDAAVPQNFSIWKTTNHIVK